MRAYDERELSKEHQVVPRFFHSKRRRRRASCSSIIALSFVGSPLAVSLTVNSKGVGIV